MEPSDADVEIDGKVKGRAGSLPAVVHTEPGTHQITLRKEGYITWRGEVSVGDAVENVEVRLVPVVNPGEGG